MRTTMSNLPKELVEEIVSRVPLQCLRAMRLTCKNWNALLESQSFKKMHIGKEEEAARELGENRMIVMMDYNVYLMGIIVNENLSIKSLGKLTCLHGSKQISQVFHCEGLLLCILKDDDTKIMVLNPYLGQTRWIQTRKYHRASECEGRDVYNYALGYETNSGNRSPKILRFIDDFHHHPENPALRYETYDFDTDLWTTLDVSPHWRIISRCGGVSLNGNTYWGAVERNASAYIGHMICFDFTRGGFGPLIPLPFKARGLVFAPLSSDRAEKIAALFRTSKKVVIWITTKIDATNVTWSNFFTIYISNLERNLSCKSFFIDMEKKVAMVFDKEKGKKVAHNIINIIGEAGCVRKLVLKESGDKSCWPLVCSYVPSTVQIKQHNRGKRQKKVIRKGIDIDLRHDKRIKVD
ncbi:unnamed protein product [Arabidopsis thaliana]|uniref:F-box domain-containing protein n=1 Tax=Arabidopsis thaliana TaxID=3702 RepID=A0A5S9XR51_ARATH|nr:unnamed protein product [Arabidopsis thaliana]